MTNIIPAAGVILLNQGTPNNAFRVLLLRRNPELKVHGGHWVFPGGKFDAEDYCAANVHPSAIDIRNPPELAEDDYMQVARNAAIREVQEESGIILEAQSLVYHSRWLTPSALSKRFDTCFFIAETPGLNVAVDGSEIIDHQWITPSESLALHRAGKIAMPPATFVTLSSLSEYTHAKTAIDALCKNVAHYRPKLITIHNGFCSLYEEDAGYESEDSSAEGKRHRLNMISGGFEYICD
jgi:8-oxo-dGTP pyrophosphatase MutT (NUDIX family)